jgi:hypothetical protein
MKLSNKNNNIGNIEERLQESIKYTSAIYTKHKVTAGDKL